MHFLKIKSHLVVKLFIIVLSFCAVSILSSPIHAYQNSDSSQALNVIEDEPLQELLAEISSEKTDEIIPEGYQWWDSDCAWIYILARIFDAIYDFYMRTAPLSRVTMRIDIIRQTLWGMWDNCYKYYDSED